MDTRVPPSISFEFERLSLDVCERAKADFDQRHLLFHELVDQLEELWRQGEAAGLDDVAAKDRALELFGDAEVAARVYRGGFAKWMVRLLTFHRYASHRFILILGSVVFVTWMKQAQKSVLGGLTSITLNGPGWWRTLITYTVFFSWLFLQCAE
jgi:hypothetical protein